MAVMWVVEQPGCAGSDSAAVSAPYLSRNRITLACQCPATALARRAI